jgi:hypothetical protein
MASNALRKSMERVRASARTTLKRKTRLRLNIHADDLKPGAAIPDGDAASATKQVENSRFHVSKDEFIRPTISSKLQM